MNSIIPDFNEYGVINDRQTIIDIIFKDIVYIFFLIICFYKKELKKN